MQDIQVQWKEARKRMAEGVEALLCFDFGITGEQLCGYTAYVLDDVFLPEFEKALGCKLPESWCVMTIESNAYLVVSSGLSKAEAVALLKQLSEEKGHGKHWTQREF